MGTYQNQTPCGRHRRNPTPRCSSLLPSPTCFSSPPTASTLPLSLKSLDPIATNMSWGRFITFICVLAITSVLTVQGWGNVFHIPTIRYDGWINASPSTSGAYEELVLNVTTMLEPRLLKNITERVNDVQENLLNVMEERAQELEGKLVREMGKELGELGSKLQVAIARRFVELEKQIYEQTEQMKERLMGKLENRTDEKMERLEEELEQRMQEMEDRLSRRLDTIAQELRRIIGDQQQPQNKTVEDTGSSTSRKKVGK